MKFLIAIATMLALLSPTYGADVSAAKTTSMCVAFKLMDKTCVSARWYVKAYGRAEAERRARLCGATDEDIALAAQCLVDHGDFR